MDQWIDQSDLKGKSTANHRFLMGVLGVDPEKQRLVRFEMSHIYDFWEKKSKTQSKFSLQTWGFSNVECNQQGEGIDGVVQPLRSYPILTLVNGEFSLGFRHIPIPFKGTASQGRWGGIFYRATFPDLAFGIHDLREMSRRTTRFMKKKYRRFD